MTVPPGNGAAGKGAGEGLEVLLVKYCGKSNLFTERSGRGVLAETSDECQLWAMLFVPHDAVPMIQKFDLLVQQFMTERGANWPQFSEANACKISTSNGRLVMNRVCGGLCGLLRDFGTAENAFTCVV